MEIDFSSQMQPPTAPQMAAGAARKKSTTSTENETNDVSYELRSLGAPLLPVVSRMHFRFLCANCNYLPHQHMHRTNKYALRTARALCRAANGTITA